MSDHGKEFDSVTFENFCEDNDFSRDVSSPKTLQLNSAVERKNHTLQ